MFVRGLTVSVATLVAAGLATASAEADHRKKHRRAMVEDHYYGPPGFVRVVPGIRLFFGDYGLTEEEYRELYGDRGSEDRFDESYYEPEPAQPVKKKKKATASATQKPSSSSDEQTASITSGNDFSSKSASNSAAAVTSSGMLSCEKATSVVSGYGFSSVTAESCKGKVYAFNASRDGKNFAVKLDPASGELTEVKKLP